MLKKDIYLFPQNNGTTTFRCFINRRLVHLVNKTGIKKKLTSHSFRHSMATALFKNGAGIREVQKLLGHSHIKSTEIYTRVARQDLKEVLKRLHPREILFKDKDK
jgi:integrase/recombinase XerD